ncbi:MAG: hypothetical protein R3C58_13015 [Parvularculaceae bacterium]
MVLASGALGVGTKNRIISALNAITSGYGRFSRDELRVRLAVLFVMTSSDYIVER